jgi:hypothetical protein
MIANSSSIIMRKRTIYILLFVSLGYNLHAQTTITGVVSDSANIPVPNTAVYISKTTIGTITDQKGAYSISIPRQGEFELTASFIGYKTKSKIIFANGNRQIINIKLSLNPVLLNEVTVRSKNKYSLNDYTDFFKLFIGDKENARNCKVVNPGDLHLYRDPGNNYLRGFSIKPLNIINKALGYSIIYDLIDFNYNIKDSILIFSGYCYFKPMQGSARIVRKWNRNRLIAYYGSRMHFLRSLYSDSVSSDNFKVFECKFDSAKNIISPVNQFDFHNLKPAIKSQYLPLFSKTPLLITYTDNHPELSSGILGFQSQEYKSTLIFSDTLKVFQNGNYDNPNSVTWYGAMVNDRVADMLPSDYLTYSNASDQPVSDRNVSKIENYLEHEQNITCEDQVFVHTDKNKYRPGDTIYFQSYVRNTFSGAFESSSTALYALLFNDQHQVVDSSRFRITNATSPGLLALPINAKPGIYHLTAFTSQMQNFDPLDAFHFDLKVDAPQNQKMNIEVRLNKDIYHPGDTLEADLKITDSNGNPSSQQSYKSSFIYKNYLIDNEESKTNRDGDSFIRFIIPDSIHFITRMQISLYNNKKERFQVKNFSIPFSDEYIDLRFLPEGGNLVAGLEQVIAFNAVDIYGEPLRVNGLLKNANGIVLDTVRSGPFGPGKFSCKAENGMFLELTNGPRNQKIWPLPVPDPSGVCLSITPADKRSFAIEVQSDSYKGDTIIVSGTMNLKQIFERKLIMDRKQHLVIKTDDLPEGIAEVTLFSKDLKPVAERLVSVNADEHLRFTVKTDKPDYSQGQEAEVTVNVSDADGKPASGIFSVSVVDSLSGHDPTIFTPGIAFALNYNPFFPSNIPSAVLEKGLENLPDDQRDLILLTYGWCRFNWNFDLTASNNKELVNYDQLKMKLLYSSGKHLANRKLDLVSLEGPSIMHLKTNKLGEISLPLASLPVITRSVTMIPDTKSSDRVTGAMLSVPYNEQYWKNKNMYLSQQTITTGLIGNISLINKLSLNEKTIEIPEVSITATRKIEYINQYEELYKYANVKSLPREKIYKLQTLEQAIRNIVPTCTILDPPLPPAIYFRQSHSFFGGNVKVVIVLDGMQLDNGWELDEVRNIPPGQISSITVLDGTQGHIIYGEEASGGVIFINTNKSGFANIRTDWKTQDKNNNMLVPIKLFRPNIEFYNPARSEIDNDPALKGRATVYWNPEVYFDSKNPVQIKYINPLRSARMIITINGVSLNNLIGTAKAGYRVNEIK